MVVVVVVVATFPSLLVLQAGALAGGCRLVVVLVHAVQGEADHAAAKEEEGGNAVVEHAVDRAAMLHRSLSVLLPLSALLSAFARSPLRSVHRSRLRVAKARAEAALTTAAGVLLAVVVVVVAFALPFAPVVVSSLVALALVLVAHSVVLVVCLQTVAKGRPFCVVVLVPVAR